MNSHMIKTTLLLAPALTSRAAAFTTLPANAPAVAFSTWGMSMKIDAFPTTRRSNTRTLNTTSIRNKAPAVPPVPVHHQQLDPNNIINDETFSQASSPAKQRIAIPNLINDPLQKYMNNLFEEADTNQDGSISEDEAYDLVLRLYIKVNQRVSIAPPSRSDINNLFQNSRIDIDGNSRIQRDEFERLVAALVSRISTRVAAHRFLTFVAAPTLAPTLVHFFPESVKHFLSQAIMDSQFLMQVLPDAVLHETFWSTALTVCMVSTLGNTVLEAAGDFFDNTLLGKNESE